MFLSTPSNVHTGKRTKKTSTPSAQFSAPLGACLNAQSPFASSYTVAKRQVVEGYKGIRVKKIGPKDTKQHNKKNAYAVPQAGRS
jgi:hypothetical protein